ncbi:MAG: hypothetical protein NTW14_12935 [bacterium]|nr:hypothetical protein [bacterium]
MAIKTCSLILIAALVCLPCLAGAEESNPSNTVGFWKINVNRGYNQVSFPLLPADKTLNNVLGSQLTGATTLQQSDQILLWNAATGQFQTSWYNTSTSTWQGEFSEVRESESYWIYVQANHPALQTIVAAGNVVATPVYNMGIMTPGYNAIGSVWAAPVPITQAGLSGIQGGVYLFLSDQIMSYDAATGSYQYAWRTDNGTWQGNLTTLEPTKGYWIYVAPGHNSFHWTNYPQPNPNGLNNPNFMPTRSENTIKATGATPFLPPAIGGDQGVKTSSPASQPPAPLPVSGGGE